MLKFPSLKNGKKKVQKYILNIGGINKTNNFREGELEFSTGLDADALPYLKSGKMETLENTVANDLLYADGVARVVLLEDGTNILYFRPEKSGTNWSSYPVELTAGKKEIASAGGKILVMPDKKILDLTQTYPAWKTIEKEVSCEDQKIYVYSNYLVFKNQTDFQNFSTAFRAGDVITFNGSYYNGNQIAKYWINKKLIIREISGTSDKKVTFDPYTFGDTSANLSGTMTFKKTIPTLTHICSWNDRVWGVSYDGKIYASRYQDPTNFEYFDLTSADSFTLDAGMGGDFTGSCATGSYVVFFRQDKIHRITGTKPSNYRHTVIKSTGVKKGAHRSLAVIDDIIYYEGKNGFYTFDGADVRYISEKLGEIVHSGGYGAVCNGNYYVSTKGRTGSHDAYIYYPKKDMWLTGGSLEYRSAVNFLGDMYYIGKDNNLIYKAQATTDTRGFDITLREFDVDIAEKKGYMRILIGFAKEQSGNITCYTAINGDDFALAKKITDGEEGVAEIRLTPNRGDRIRLRISGSSDAIIKYIMREYYTHGL